MKLKRRSGETGRRKGLKIPRASGPCGFNPRLRHRTNPFPGNPGRGLVLTYRPHLHIQATAGRGPWRRCAPGRARPRGSSRTGFSWVMKATGSGAAMSVVAIAAAGVGAAILVDAVSFFFAAASLLVVRFPRAEAPTERSPWPPSPDCLADPGWASSWASWASARLGIDRAVHTAGPDSGWRGRPRPDPGHRQRRVADHLAGRGPRCGPRPGLRHAHP